jgi:NitT/TauT family transport system substrate-binding protein
MLRVASTLVLLSVALVLGGAAHAADLGSLKVGTLRFGTVNWELDVIEHHGLDAKEGFTLEVQPFGGNDAADVALMGDAVDMIVEDWLWVTRQRESGAMLTFVPYSSSIGALMVRPDAGIAGLADLRGKKIGVAGGPLDKSWLLIQAHAKEKAGLDLAGDAEPVFGAPPLLTEKFKGGELQAVLNYWNHSARLEAEGAVRLLDVAAVQESMGVPANTPQLGYVFKEEWAEANTELAKAFVRASRAAKAIMKRDDAEWDRLRAVTKADDDTIQNAYMRRYREGIVESWGQKERTAAADLYRVLAKLGGSKLVGGGDALAPGTFWAQVVY